MCLLVRWYSTHKGKKKTNKHINLKMAAQDVCLYLLVMGSCLLAGCKISLENSI